MSRLWRPLSATVDAASPGAWVGCQIVSPHVWDSAAPAAVRARCDCPPQTDRAAVETVGEGADVCEGARAGDAGGRSAIEASAEEKDRESEAVGEHLSDKKGLSAKGSWKKTRDDPFLMTCCPVVLHALRPNGILWVCR